MVSDDDNLKLFFDKTATESRCLLCGSSFPLILGDADCLIHLKESHPDGLILFARLHGISSFESSIQKSSLVEQINQLLGKGNYVPPRIPTITENILMDGIREEWTGGCAHSDARIVCGDGVSVQSHRLVLASMSQTFRQAMSDLEDSETVIVMPEAKSSTVTAFLEQVYGGVTDMTEDDLSEATELFCINRPPVFVPQEQPKTAESVPLEDDRDLFEDIEDALQADRSILLRKDPCDYFRIEPHHPAVCTLCRVEVECIAETESFNGGLKRHLREFHPEVDVETVEGSKAPQERKEDEWEPDMSAQDILKEFSKDLIWSYFRRVDELDIECLHCNKKMECGIVSSTEGHGNVNGCRDDLNVLEKHLESEHPEEFVTFKSSQTDILEDGSKKKKKKKSPVWEYFNRTKDKCVTVCKECQRSVKTLDQNTSNMMKHLKSNHKDIYRKIYPTAISNNGRVRKVKVDKRAKKPEANAAPKDNDPDSRRCKECGKIYASRASMQYHMKVVHSGIRPYKCDECGTTFARLDSFRNHNHSRERNFLCTVCGKTFSRKNIRDVHERAHIGDRRFPCSFCFKKFMTSQQKNNHERIHTGEKPFQCTECGRQFAQQHQLKTHLRIHTGEKPYSCQHCSQTFRHLSSRNNHKCEGKVAEAEGFTLTSPFENIGLS